MKINESYKSYDSFLYPNLTEIRFEDKLDMKDSLNEISSLIMKSDEVNNENYWLDGSARFNSGVLIYRSLNDETKAYKIYKDWGDYNIFPHFDAKILQKLQERQDGIKLTEFPSGVITINGRQIGQTILFYNNSKTLLSATLNNSSMITEYFLMIIDIMKELDKNGIYYKDIHSKNFIIDSNNQIKLIDFEDGYVSFDDARKYLYDDTVLKLKKMFINLGEIRNIKFTDFDKIKTLDELKESIHEKHITL